MDCLQNFVIKKPMQNIYDHSTTPPTRMVVCVDCGNKRKYRAKNMCGVCYGKLKNNKRTKATNLIF